MDIIWNNNTLKMQFSKHRLVRWITKYFPPEAQLTLRPLQHIHNTYSHIHVTCFGELKTQGRPSKHVFGGEGQPVEDC